MDKRISTIEITQVRSLIGSTKKQRATMAALGLRKINHRVAHKASPALDGMIRKIFHLVITT